MPENRTKAIAMIRMKIVHARGVDKSLPKRVPASVQNKQTHRLMDVNANARCVACVVVGSVAT